MRGWRPGFAGVRLQRAAAGGGDRASGCVRGVRGFCGLWPNSAPREPLRERAAFVRTTRSRLHRWSSPHELRP